MSRRSRTVLLYALPFVLGVVWLLGPVIVGSETLFLRDLFNTHLEMKWFQAEAMRSGSLPFVDPYRAGGQPHLGSALPGQPALSCRADDLVGQRPLLAASPAGAGRLLLPGPQVGAGRRGGLGGGDLLRHQRLLPVDPEPVQPDRGNDTGAGHGRWSAAHYCGRCWSSAAIR